MQALFTFGIQIADAEKFQFVTDTAPVYHLGFNPRLAVIFHVYGVGHRFAQRYQQAGTAQTHVLDHGQAQLAAKQPRLL